jgi:hypothetical protein
LKVEGNFNVTGPLETFANAGGVHLASAILAEFAENVAKLVAEQAGEATAPHPDPLTAGGEKERAGSPQNDEQPRTATPPEADDLIVSNSLRKGKKRPRGARTVSIFWICVISNSPLRRFTASRLPNAIATANLESRQSRRRPREARRPDQ